MYFLSAYLLKERTLSARFCGPHCKSSPEWGGRWKVNLLFLKKETSWGKVWFSSWRRAFFATFALMCYDFEGFLFSSKKNNKCNIWSVFMLSLCLLELLMEHSKKRDWEERRRWRRSQKPWNGKWETSNRAISSNNHTKQSQQEENWKKSKKRVKV